MEWAIFSLALVIRKRPRTCADAKAVHTPRIPRERRPTVFEQFVKRPFHLALYRNGPYAEERSRFLAHLAQEGRGRNRLKVINWLLLKASQHVDLNGQRSYTADAL